MNLHLADKVILVTGGAKGIGHIDIRKSRELSRKVRIVSFFARVKPQILEKQDLSALERLDHHLDSFADAIIGQGHFLPKKLPNHGRVKFNRLYRPAGHVSGDLYDVRRLDEQHVGVYLADAIGHGMPAALLAMFMHNALQTKRISLDGGYELLSSHEAMRLLNETLCGQELAHTTFATAVYSRVNLETGQIDFSRGGHPLPMLIRTGGEIEEIGGEGALLGVMPEERFEPLSLTLAPGDRLIFFTDGVETLFVPPGEPADMDCWRAAMRERGGMPADELLADLWQHFEKRGAVDDDVTVVTMEMT